MSYNSYDVSLENQVLDQPHVLIPLSIFSFNLITCLLDILLLLWREILSWSLMGVKESKASIYSFFWSQVSDQLPSSFGIDISR